MLVPHSLQSIILSSVPNYLEISGLQENTPSKITFSGMFFDNEEFTLVNNDYRKTFRGGVESKLTDSTYSTLLNLIISLYECLKLNTGVFTEIKLNLALQTITLNISNGFSLEDVSGITINIQSSNMMMNKTVVLIGDNIELSKYHYTSSIKFNISDPFDNITFFEPKTYALNSYSIQDSVITINPIISLISVLPTTLSKYEWVNYNNYTLTSGESTLRNILTNRQNSNYNYNEEIVISILEQTLLSLSLSVKYYTVSGVYINSEVPTVSSSYTRPRLDIRFTPNLQATELLFHNDIGYFTVEVLQGTTVKTRPLKFIVNPKCNTNNVFYFVNKIGGLDSFNFLREKSLKGSITEQVTYFKNDIDFNNINELEYVHSKKYNENFTAETTLLDGEQAEYITELAKSKYVYKYVNGIKTIIIIDKLDINLDSLNNQGYNIRVEYHYSDNRA